MFGIKRLRRRVEELESRVMPMVHERDCAAKRHEWETVKIYFGDPPFIRCKHCYKQPEKKA